MSRYLLEATHLSHGFEYPLFDGIHVALEAKESLAIVGRSGSGKSTLLHLLSSFIEPNEGEVKLFGENLYSRSQEEIEALRRYDIGMVFQFHYLFKGMRALENIQIATLLSEESFDVSIVKALEVEHLMEQKTSSLSGGEQQRISIARVLSKKPRIIFADEPTGNLDSENASKVIEVLLAYIQKYEAVLVLVTHDEQLAKRCKYSYRLEERKLKEMV
jgi:putative ABC transport system ATP-binding protein